MIAAGFERCVSMSMSRMIVHCPHGTACQREQKEPDCEQASEKHYRPAAGFNNSI